MKTVNIGDLKNQLSAYLQYVKSGEDVIVRDRNCPIARITSYSPSAVSEEEQQLVASGEMKLAENEMDWSAFWASPSGKLSKKAAVQAVLDDRAERGR
jgi:prevent-host-death family protein